MTERQLADELHGEVKEIIGATEACLVQHFLQAFLRSVFRHVQHPNRHDFTRATVKKPGVKMLSIESWLFTWDLYNGSL